MLCSDDQELWILAIAQEFEEQYLQQLWRQSVRFEGRCFQAPRLVLSEMTASQANGRRS